MSKMIPGNGKHLTLDERITIHRLLDEDCSLKHIAKVLCKDPTTIAREIKKHRQHHHGSSHVVHNHCALKNECKRYNVCNQKPQRCHKRCNHCNLCNRKCPDFIPDECHKRKNKAPYVCNGCPKKTACRQDKYYYTALIAEDEYNSVKETCRVGFNLTEEEIMEIDSIVSPLVARGQSLHHIYYVHKSKLPCSERTLYRLIDECQLEARNIDLQRTVRRKKRKARKQTDSVRAKAVRENRDYQCFKAYLSEHDTNVVEMDTVIGNKNSQKVLLTLFFRNSSLMLIYLMPDNTQNSVKKVFDDLESALGLDLFRKVFPCILTDNGSEFLNPDELETSIFGFPRTKVFYCDPNSPYQKGGIEKNHEYIRYILPKGTSFDALYQKDINKVVYHINSTIREKLGNHTPYEIAQLYFDKEVFERLCLKKIPLNKVCLKPTLLK